MNTSDLDTLKVCSTCRVGKPLSAFAKDKHRNDGLQNKCRACASEYARDYRARHREELNAYGRAWRAENPTYAAEYREYGPRNDR